jgi:predicted DNA-binding transcriptional regulator YafY
VDVFDTLREAIEKRRCVTMMADGKRRDVAPLAIGVKGAQKKVLTFQFKGDSSSGLAPGGAWRCFSLDRIVWVALINEPWQSGHYPVAKLEASFDYVICGHGAQVRTYNHLKRPA